MAAVALAVGTLLIYAPYVGWAPVYLAHDEVVFSLNAYTIASSGHAVDGRPFPVYFHISGNFWATPINIYLTALLFKIAPVSEVTIRLVTVLIGTLDVVLLYCVARAQFARERSALIAAALLALTPAHFIHSRLAVDHLYIVPFMLVWLLCLTLYLQRSDERWLFAGTSALGVGVYSYLAAMVMMPVYLILTVLALYRQHEKSIRPYAIAAAGFAWPLIVLAWWLTTNPSQFGDQIRMYSIYDSKRFGPLQGLKELASYTSLTARSGVYYDFFNPSFLFFSGDSSLINATRHAGVFLFPIAVMFPLGVYRLLTSGLKSIDVVVLLGFLSAPLAATVVAEPHRINRALVMLPFVILISTHGLEYLLSIPQRRWRLLAVILLLFVPLQFRRFYLDYIGDYRVRSSVWFENNIRGGLEEIITRLPRGEQRPVYLSTDIPWIDSYWPFYLAKHARPDLSSRTVYFDPKQQDVETVPVGALTMTRAQAAPTGACVPIAEANGAPVFIVCERR